jgi:hypothetical protein
MSKYLPIPKFSQQGAAINPEVLERSSEETLASRLREVIGSESVASFARRSEVGESALRKYLDGAQPNANSVLLMSDAGGCTTDWLISGRTPRMRADVRPPCTPADQTEMLSAESSDEFELLKRYRQADSEQKATVRALLEAIAHPGGMAWYRLGEAITRIANIFPRKH